MMPRELEKLAGAFDDMPPPMRRQNRGRGGREEGQSPPRILTGKGRTEKWKHLSDKNGRREQEEGLGGGENEETSNKFGKSPGAVANREAQSGRYNKAVWKEIFAEIAPRLKYCPPRTLGLVLNAMARLKISNNRFLVRVREHMTASTLRRSSMHEICNVANAFAKLQGGRVARGRETAEDVRGFRELFRRIAKESIWKMDEANGLELSVIANAFVKAQCLEEELFRFIARETKERAGDLLALHTKEKEEQGEEGETTEMEERQSESLQAKEEDITLEGRLRFSAQQMSSLLLSLSKAHEHFRRRPSTEGPVRQELQEALHEGFLCCETLIKSGKMQLSFNNISNLCQALQKSHTHHASLLGRMAMMVVRHEETIPHQHVATIAAAFGSLGLFNSRLFERLAEDALKGPPASEWKGPELLMLLRGCTAAGAFLLEGPPRDLFAFLAGALASRLPEADSDVFVASLQGLSWASVQRLKAKEPLELDAALLSAGAPLVFAVRRVASAKVRGCPFEKLCVLFVTSGRLVAACRKVVGGNGKDAHGSGEGKEDGRRSEDSEKSEIPPMPSSSSRNDESAAAASAVVEALGETLAESHAIFSEALKAHRAPRSTFQRKLLKMTCTDLGLSKRETLLVLGETGGRREKGAPKGGEEGEGEGEDVTEGKEREDLGRDSESEAESDLEEESTDRWLASHVPSLKEKRGPQSSNRSRDSVGEQTHRSHQRKEDDENSKLARGEEFFADEPAGRSKRSNDHLDKQFTASLRGPFAFSGGEGEDEGESGDFEEEMEDIGALPSDYRDAVPVKGGAVKRRNNSPRNNRVSGVLRSIPSASQKVIQEFEQGEDRPGDLWSNHTEHETGVHIQNEMLSDLNEHARDEKSTPRSRSEFTMKGAEAVAASRRKQRSLRS
uniref:Uncharacterized protein n=1 Tax=Chromera velia CCMP2878 TaxID=1169474 RepID=A0A0G4HA71_9ALVE|eukprot:Cvel_25593.t1-p1 / transcript=Cvel_25593.t1 / gene=Cvel_25593 / organism=Chromera_velia_CCMP2878 / gene_product=hypothetical protein / transcript_product=hypothetical protein / location=Cvel_scaffold2920:8125-13612(-) / protein_length=902 / sequence_SO=supercontig / SO=protein_coding / is_pseudo=false